MKKQKKSGKAAMRIDVRLEYTLVWGDYGVENHVLEGTMTVEHSSDEAIVMAMQAVVERERDFLDYWHDAYGRIEWRRIHWKGDWEQDYTTENLRLLNTPGIVRPILGAQRNGNWQKPYLY